MATPTNGSLLVVCKFCLNEEVKTCLKCGSNFCADHASKFLPSCCKECFGNNIKIVFDKYIRSSTDYDPVTNELYKHSSVADRIQVEGGDWTFYTRWLAKIDNDEDLKSIYEFHYFVLKLIEHHNENRKIAKARKAKEVSGNYPISTKTTKETRVKREVKQQDMQQALEKLGLPSMQIRAMVEAVGIKYVEHT